MLYIVIPLHFVTVNPLLILEIPLYSSIQYCSIPIVFLFPVYSQCLFSCFSVDLDFASTTTTETNTTDATIDTTTRTQAAPDSINPFPQSAIIAIAVSGGVVILAAVIVLITCLICCLLYKSRSTKAGTRQDDLSRNQWQNSGALVNNPSYNYNDGISRDRLAANPAYNQGHVQLMDNSAYNANGGDDPYYSVIRE